MSKSNSFASAEQWLDKLESELVSVSPSTASDVSSDLSSDSVDNSEQPKSRKIRNRMMQLYLTIAGDDSKQSNKTSPSESQPYYTIVDSSNNNLNNINSAFLKKLDEKEIAQLKKLMLTRELSDPQTSVSKTQPKSQTQTQQATNNVKDNRMLVLCSPINKKTNKLIDSLIDQLEKQHLAQDSHSTSQLASDNTTEWFSVHSPTKSRSNSMHPSIATSSDNFEFDEMNAKTEALKTRIINLKKKYEILKQKRAFESNRKKKLFSAHMVNSKNTTTVSKQSSRVKKTNLKQKRHTKTSNAQDFQTKLKRYGTHYNVNANGFQDNHVEIIERRSASMIINPKSLTKTAKKTRKTKRKGVKSQRKRRRRNPAARIPWRG